MKLLVIGGTQFSGRALTGMALERGDEVTIFHRGSGTDDVYPEAEHVHGDRDEGVDALRGRTFDAVVDTCGYVPRAVRASAGLLADSAWYGYISSISAHLEGLPPGATEDSPTHQPPWPDSEEITWESYGPLKAACEEVVREGFGDRGAV
ncbi:MAG TPA: epimerase, partial [Actinomycetota bacterium]|nr:epimerase [Actinomycetota bacterium]